MTAYSAAVIGRGSIGDRHLGVLGKILGAERVAQFPAGLRDGLSPARIVRDVLQTGASHVVVASPAHLHLAFAEPLLAAGRQCLIEKPLVLSSAEALYLRPRLAAGNPVQVGYNLHFRPEYQFLVEHIGELGSLLWAEFRCGQSLEQWRPGRALDSCVTTRRDWGGGVLRELSHELEVALSLLGPLAVQGAMTQTGRFGQEVEEAASLALRTGSGCPVSVQLDLYRPVPERTVFLVGELGELKVDMVGCNGYCKIGEHLHHLEFDKVDTYELQARAFLGHLTLPHAPRVADALATVDLIEQIENLVQEA